MQKIYRFCLIFSLFNLLSACTSGWPEELKGTSFEPINKTTQSQGEYKK